MPNTAQQQVALFSDQTYSRREAQAAFLGDEFVRLAQICPEFSYILDQFSQALRRNLRRDSLSDETRILNAIRQGFDTAKQISKRTLIPPMTVYVRLDRLVRTGKLEKTRRMLPHGRDDGAPFEYFFTIRTGPKPKPVKRLRQEAQPLLLVA